MIKNVKSKYIGHITAFTTGSAVLTLYLYFTCNGRVCSKFKFSKTRVTDFKNMNREVITTMIMMIIVAVMTAN
jgi:hypothetical protein